MPRCHIGSVRPVTSGIKARFISQARDMVAIVDRVTRLEAIVGDPRDGSATNLVVVCVELNMRLAELQTAHANLLERHEGLIHNLEHRQLQQQRSDLAMEEWLETRMRAMEEKLIQLRQVARSLSSTNMAGATGSKVKIREPKNFEGARNAKEVENFLWDMEVYFRALKILDVDQVDRASMFLEGDAKLWWRIRAAEDISAGQPKIET